MKGMSKWLAVIVVVLAACSQPPQPATKVEPVTVVNWTAVQLDPIVADGVTIKSCVLLATTKRIAEPPALQGIVLPAWLYDTVFLPNCEERLVFRAANMKIVALRGERDALIAPAP